MRFPLKHVTMTSHTPQKMCCCFPNPTIISRTL